LPYLLPFSKLCDPFTILLAPLFNVFIAAFDIFLVAVLPSNVPPNAVAPPNTALVKHRVLLKFLNPLFR